MASETCRYQSFDGYTPAYHCHYYFAAHHVDVNANVTWYIDITYYYRHGLNIFIDCPPSYKNLYRGIIIDHVDSGQIVIYGFPLSMLKSFVFYGRTVFTNPLTLILLSSISFILCVRI